jgi:hypothetical protein
MNHSMLSEDGDLEDNILIQFMKTFYDQQEQTDKESMNLDKFETS